MAITTITGLFRAVIRAECIFEGNTTITRKLGDEACERMQGLEVKAKALAEKHGVSFESLNTKGLWQGAFQLESSDEGTINHAVEAIESLILTTPSTRIVA